MSEQLVSMQCESCKFRYSMRGEPSGLCPKCGMHTDQVDSSAEDVVQHHWSNAWRKRMATKMMSESGRYTKAKQHEADIAAAEARAIEAVVRDLRAAGYTIEDN